MTLPLLSTKFRIPPTRPGFVRRPRLIDRLDAGIESDRHKLILVSAPPGFGKTSLLADWASRTEANVVWLALDESDNDPAQFWTGALLAVRSVDKRPAAALDELRMASEEAFAALVSSLDGVARPWALVLDDWHTITRSQIADRLFVLLARLPPRSHLILATRADPAWPLGRLRARGDILELRAGDLRFTSDEVHALLRTATDGALSDADMATLERRTEGWVAGLQLAVLSMRQRDPHAFVRDFGASHRFILDYLLEEVLDRQPRQVQDFLLDTSILDALSAEICDAVRGRAQDAGDPGPSSQDMLERLDRENLFVTPLDDDRHWYRYHRLFADLLRIQLNRRYPERVATLHLRASRWYEHAAQVARAVDHALEAGDEERIAHLVEHRALAMIYHGRLNVLTGWLNGLPSTLVREHPWLNVATAWALAYSGDLDAAEARLPASAGDLRTPVSGSDETPVLMGHTAAIRAYCALLRGDHTVAVTLAREAMQHLPPHERSTRGFVAAVLGTVFGAGNEPANGLRLFDDALAASRSAGDELLEILVLSEIAALQHKLGHLHEAAARCREALELSQVYTRKTGERSPAAAFAHIRLASVLREWDDLEAAMIHSRQAVAGFTAWGQDDGLLIATVAQAELRAARGDLAGALNLVREAEPIAEDLSWYRDLLDALSAYLAARLGATPRAPLRANASARVHDVSTWFWDNRVRRVDGLEVDACATHLLWGRTGLVLAEAAHLPDPKPYARAVLEAMDEVRPLIEAAGAMRYLVQADAVAAVALSILGDGAGARRRMIDTLRVAEPEGYVQSIVSAGRTVAVLLRDIDLRFPAPACASGPSHGYVRRLLAALDSALPSGDPAGAPPLAEPLSDRELDVLRLLPTALTTPEIGEALFISKITVRTHFNHIYEKLDVHSRVDAVERAETLGLL